MDNQYKPNNVYKLISAILELVCALVLVGFAVYYYVLGQTMQFWLLLAFGVLFICTSCYSIFKYAKQKKAEKAASGQESEQGAENKQNSESGKGPWDMNTVGGNRR